MNNNAKPVALTQYHLDKAIGIFRWAFNKYGKTNLGSKGVARAMGLGPDRDAGQRMLNYLLSNNYIECIGVDGNHYPEGVASLGHDPNVDQHTDATPYYVPGTNWR